LLFRGMKTTRFNFIEKTVVILCLLAITFTLLAQNGTSVLISSASNPDDMEMSSLINLQNEYILKLYSVKIEAPKELINGKEYEPYFTRSKVKPLLFPEKERTGSIITNTREYNNLTLQYDTYLDEVIYTDTSRIINNRFPQIALNKNILKGFNLYFSDDKMTFIYYRQPEGANSNPGEGFYEVAYEGRSRYLIKHESTFYVREALKNYKYSPKNYISTGNSFYKIKSEKNLLQLFGEKADSVKTFMHSSYIKVRKADKGQIIRILKYYDSL
jgi:hypothetical protein